MVVSWYDGEVGISNRNRFRIIWMCQTLICWRVIIYFFWKAFLMVTIVERHSLISFSEYSYISLHHTQSRVGRTKWSAHLDFLEHWTFKFVSDCRTQIAHAQFLFYIWLILNHNCGYINRKIVNFNSIINIKQK